MSAFVNFRFVPFTILKHLVQFGASVVASYICEPQDAASGLSVALVTYYLKLVVFSADNKQYLSILFVVVIASLQQVLARATVSTFV